MRCTEDYWSYGYLPPLNFYRKAALLILILLIFQAAKLDKDSEGVVTWSLMELHRLTKLLAATWLTGL